MNKNVGLREEKERRNEDRWKIMMFMNNDNQSLGGFAHVSAPGSEKLAGRSSSANAAGSAGKTLTNPTWRENRRRRVFAGPSANAGPPGGMSSGGVEVTGIARNVGKTTMNGELVFFLFFCANECEEKDKQQRRKFGVRRPERVRHIRSRPPRTAFKLRRRARPNGD